MHYISICPGLQFFFIGYQNNACAPLPDHWSGGMAPQRLMTTRPYRSSVMSKPTRAAGIRAKTMPGKSMPFKWNHFW